MNVFYTITNLYTKQIMDRTIDIFIPFIDSNISKKCVEKILLDQNFGQIMDIKMNDKKINQNGKLKSAHHKYAFIKIFIFNTLPGNNMLNNLKEGKTTHIIYNDVKNTINLDIKPYLSLNERSQKGFELHVKNFKQSFYDNILEKRECENDYNELEKELNQYYTGELQ